MLRTVAAFSEPWEAFMFASRLEAEEIPSFVAHGMHVGNAWHYSFALGGAKVQVLTEDFADARNIETLCRRGDYVSLLETEFGPLEETCCTNCGSTEKWKRRPFPRAIAAIAILTISGMILPPLGWVYFCESCGTKYRAPLHVRSRQEWSLIAIATFGVTAALLITLFAIWLILIKIGQYWFVSTIVAVIFAGQGVRKWLERLNAEIE